VEAVAQHRPVAAVSQPDPKPDSESELKTDLRRPETVEVAVEMLGEPVLVNIPRADNEQEAAEDNAGRAGNELEEEKVDKRKDTVTGGSMTVKLYASKGVVYAVMVRSRIRGSLWGRSRSRESVWGSLTGRGSLWGSPTSRGSLWW
jgi:hypothetical protein